MILLFYFVPPALDGTRFEDFALKIKNGFVWYYCIIVGLIFAPTLVLNYAQSDIHYIFEYGGLAFVGNLLGYAFHRDKYY